MDEVSPGSDVETDVSQRMNTSVKYPPPGYFECKRIIARLRLFQDLARYREGFGHEIQFARTLEELLPEGTSEAQRPFVIDRELNRLIPIIHRDLHRAEIPTDMVEVTKKSTKFDKEGHVVETVIVKGSDYDILEHFHGHQNVFQVLMTEMERAIGVYQEWQNAAFRDFFNPLVWLAWFIRLPISLRERAGLQDAATASCVIQGYGWIIRVCVAVLIVLTVSLVLTWLGVPVPWDKIWDRFLSVVLSVK